MKESQVLVATAAASLGLLAVSALFSPRPAEALPGRVRRLADALFARAGGEAGSGKTVLHGLPKVPIPELREVGAASLSGERQFMSKRLYMQLRVLDIDLAKIDMDAFISKLKAKMASVPCVLYRDTVANDSLALLTWSEDPTFFATSLNGILGSKDLAPFLTERTGWTMFGKTYSNGHEKDLEEFLFKKPVRTATKEDWDWAVWYPLKRRGPFYMQPPDDQCRMLLQHAAIGKAFSDLNAAHDIRLKCFGLDAQDNEYILGLCGDDLHGLSRVVEEMRKTRHTAEFLESLGPFFVGKRLWSNLL